MANEPTTRPSFTSRRRWSVGFDVVVRTSVVLAVVIMANHLAGKFFVRHYVSEHTRAELSPRTLSLLQSLTNEVRVTMYYDRESRLFGTISALLREYHAQNPHITVDAVDYLRDVSEAQRVKTAHKLPETSKEDEKDYIIFECEGRSRVVPGNALADYQLETGSEKGTYDRRPVYFKGETLFTAYLLAVTNPKPFKAYVLEGHGEHSIESGDEVTGYLGFKSLLEQNYVKVETLTLTSTNGVPQDCNLLIIPGPRVALAAIELERVEQYLKEGGRLLALFNSDNMDREAGLEKVLAKWNVLVSGSVVTDPKNSLTTSTMSVGENVTIGAFSRHPAVSGLFNFFLNLRKPRVIVAAPGRDAPDAPKLEVLFATENTATLINNSEASPRQYPLAVAVEKSAVRGVATGRGTMRMIVVGDSFFLANKHMTVFANRDFADYAINWLLDRPQFTEGIGPRPVSDFRITLTSAQMKSVQWLLLGAIPGGVLLFGGLVWLRRLK